MSLFTYTLSKNCIKNIQFFIVFTLLIFSNTSNCSEKRGLSLRMLDVNYKIQDREPATFKVSEDGFIRPIDFEININDLLIEDNAGVLVSVRENLKKWDETEEYVKNWNLESTGLYHIVDSEAKKAYINRHILKYVDKRLSGEIKAAEEGSALRKVGQVQKALKPNTTVQISKLVEIKFKAKVIQGKAYMTIKNPIAEYKTTFSADGDIDMNLKREFKALKVKSNIDYNVRAGRWIASFDRPLSSKINSRLSTSQSSKDMAFSSNSDQKFELFFNHAF